MPQRGYPISYFALTILCLLSLFFAFGQRGNWLDIKLATADSVILVSHESLLSENETPAGESGLPRPVLMVGGKINYNLVKERRVLAGTNITALAKILNSAPTQTVYTMHGCFDPHHTIFIIKSGKISYIDLCFGCERFESSADMKKLYLYETRKWANLYNYFKKLGFKYEMKK